LTLEGASPAGLRRAFLAALRAMERSPFVAPYIQQALAPANAAGAFRGLSRLDRVLTFKHT
jgi:hypothetical protein